MPALAGAEDRDGARYRTLRVRVGQPAPGRSSSRVATRASSRRPSEAARRSRKPAGRRRTSRSAAADAGGRVSRPESRFPSFRITPDRYAPHRYAGASLDFTPFHLDADLARAIGLPGIILHGLYTYGQLAHGLLEPFGGDPRVLRALAARFRRPAVPEHELLSRERRRVAGDRVEVACAVHQDGREVITEGVAGLDCPAGAEIVSHSRSGNVRHRRAAAAK